jgi:CRP/FNR family transcriptional regulator
MLEIQEIRKLFPNLNELPLLEELSQAANPMEFKAGDVLMDYGDYIRFVPLVLEGTIRVMRQSEEGQELLLYYLSAGDTCSMAFTCCLTQKKSQIKTVAEEDCTVLGIPLQYMEKWMSYTSWRNFIFMSYQNRFEELFNALDSLAFRKMDERLAQYLWQKAQTLQTYTLFITHQDIARDLNASREAVSRLLKKMENDKIIELGRNRIDVHPKKYPAFFGYKTQD